MPSSAAKRFGALRRYEARRATFGARRYQGLHGTELRLGHRASDDGQVHVALRAAEAVAGARVHRVQADEHVLVRREEVPRRLRHRSLRADALHVLLHALVDGAAEDASRQGCHGAGHHLGDVARRVHGAGFVRGGVELVWVHPRQRRDGPGPGETKAAPRRRARARCPRGVRAPPAGRARPPAARPPRSRAARRPRAASHRGRTRSAVPPLRRSRGPRRGPRPRRVPNGRDSRSRDRP